MFDDIWWRRRGGTGKHVQTCNLHLSKRTKHLAAECLALLQNKFLVNFPPTAVTDGAARVSDGSIKSLHRLPKAAPFTCHVQDFLVAIQCRTKPDSLHIRSPRPAPESSDIFNALSFKAKRHSCECYTAPPLRAWKALFHGKKETNSLENIVQSNTVEPEPCSQQSRNKLRRCA